MKKNSKIRARVNIKPISINRAYQGRRYRTGEFKKYQEAVLFSLPRQEAIRGNVAVFLNVYLKCPKRSDVDNYIKPILDIIQKAGYIKDDRNVYFLQAQKYQRDEEGFEIEIVRL